MNRPSSFSSIGSVHADQMHLSHISMFLRNRGELGSEIIEHIDWLAANCGWKPLAVGEEMTVTLGNKNYTIKRNQ